MSTRWLLAVITFLTLVPVTLPVPGLQELVGGRFGGSETDSHAFMTINMVFGMLGVPFTMRAVNRPGASTRAWLTSLLVADAVAFVGMMLAPSLGFLYVFRALDGYAHLSAVSILMVASNRLSNEGRGGALGALATAIMMGVAVGSPLGGWLVTRGTGAVFGWGAAMLVVATMLVRRVPPIPAATAPRSRYEWNRAAFATWVPLAYAFMDRFSVGIFVSSFTLYLTNILEYTAPQRGLLIALFMLPFAVLCYPAGRLADRFGWFVPMLVGNVMFGLVFASYGFAPKSLMPALMVASGVFSALMFAPNMLLISDLVKRGQGEGLFGAFQVAGSLGFLTGPVVGGVLVSLTRNAEGVPAYREIFAGVGGLEAILAVVCWSALRGLSREVSHGAEPAKAPMLGGSVSGQVTE